MRKLRRFRQSHMRTVNSMMKEGNIDPGVSRIASLLDIHRVLHHTDGVQSLQHHDHLVEMQGGSLRISHEMMQFSRNRAVHDATAIAVAELHRGWRSWWTHEAGESSPPEQPTKARVPRADSAEELHRSHQARQGQAAQHTNTAASKRGMTNGHSSVVPCCPVAN